MFVSFVIVAPAPKDQNFDKCINESMAINIQFHKVYHTINVHSPRMNIILARQLHKVMIE